MSIHLTRKIQVLVYTSIIGDINRDVRMLTLRGGLSAITKSQPYRWMHTPQDVYITGKVL